MDLVIYVHGKGGSIAEAEHYNPLFPSCDVLVIACTNDEPWNAGKEIYSAVTELTRGYDRTILIANSIGAYLSMHAGIEKYISHAYFISPVVDMERLIVGMMFESRITESELQKRGIVPCDSGEELSWEYLCYVRSHPVRWNIPTDILYGSKDGLISLDTISAFAHTHRASLTIMDGGEHWFHTDAQMRFLDDWLVSLTSIQQEFSRLCRR